MGHGIVKTVAQQYQAFCARIGQNLFQHGQGGKCVIGRHMQSAPCQTCTLLQMQVSDQQLLLGGAIERSRQVWREGKSTQHYGALSRQAVWPRG